MKVKVEKKDGTVVLPTHATPLSAGVDLVANSFIKKYSQIGEVNVEDKESVYLQKGDRVLVGTGLKIELPIGYELQIRSRSGNALKKGLVVLNQPGTIDADYRGEIGVILYNASHTDINIYLGDKIAQGVLAKHEVIDWEVVDALEKTIRNEGGYGSTDKPSEDKPLSVITRVGIRNMTTEEYVQKKFEVMKTTNSDVTIEDISNSLYRCLNGLEPITALDEEVKMDLQN